MRCYHRLPQATSQGGASAKLPGGMQSHQGPWGGVQRALAGVLQAWVSGYRERFRVCKAEKQGQGFGDYLRPGQRQLEMSMWSALVASAQIALPSLASRHARESLTRQGSRHAASASECAAGAPRQHQKSRSPMTVVRQRAVPHLADAGTELPQIAELQLP